MNPVLTRRIIRITAVIMIILFFIPAFSVSCAGQTVTISGTKAMMGIKYQSQEISKPSVSLLLLLVIPIGLLFFWRARRIGNDVVRYVITSIACVIYLLVWKGFYEKVHRGAAEYYAGVENRFGFYGSVFSGVIVLVISVYTLYKKRPEDSDLFWKSEEKDDEVTRTYRYARTSLKNEGSTENSEWKMD